MVAVKKDQPATIQNAEPVRDVPKLSKSRSAVLNPSVLPQRKTVCLSLFGHMSSVEHLVLSVCCKCKDVRVKITSY